MHLSVNPLRPQPQRHGSAYHLFMAHPIFSPTQFEGGSGQAAGELIAIRESSVKIRPKSYMD